jgi:hypothetical protein
MAKRSAPDEQPYRPLLDQGLMQSAIAQVVPANSTPATEPSARATPSKVVDLPRTPESIRRAEAATEIGVMAPAVREQLRTPQPLVEKFDQEKRILFTRAETQAIDRLVNSIATRLNAQVKVSHVMRALVTLLLNAEGEVDRRAGEAGPLVRPPNGDGQALQRFERDIAKVLASAIRDAGPLR